VTNDLSTDGRNEEMSTASTLTTRDKVRRLVRFATGDEYGDGEMVTDIILGYAEPGYGSVPSGETPIIVLGNWNPRRVPGEDRKSKHPAVTLPKRLGEALERAGAGVHWLDEWARCDGCYRAVRTEPDSYSWQPSYALTDGGLLCHDCLRECGEDALDEYVNDSGRAVTWADGPHLESFGYVKWEPRDPHTYESAHHSGQDDEPADVLAEIQGHYDDARVIFLLDEASQFYVRFSAYVKIESEDEQ
jgi:hypothetical protein